MPRVLIAMLVLLGLTAGGAATASARVTTDPADTPLTATAAAWQWLQRQGGTGTDVVSASTITPASAYAASWTGAVSGTFDPVKVSAPVVDPAALTVDQPTTVPDDSTATLHGHVLVPPAAGRWIVQAYRDTPTGQVQVPLQALAAADGTFSIDLGAVTAPPAGHWSLGLLDATKSYAPAGVAWPAASVLSGWQVQAFVTTDATYLVDTQPARADHTFAFARSQPGTKSFRLVATGSGAVLAEAAPNYGLLRSNAGGTVAYSYDQALAVVTALSLGHSAGTLTSGLLSLQRPDGGFVTSADVLNPAGTSTPEWTGNSAVATWALLRQLQTLPASDASAASLRAAAAHAVDWLLARQRADGLLDPGVDSDGSAAGSYASTEHALDGWQALHLAATVLGDTRAETAAATLATAIVARLWDDADGRFRQGLQPDGPDNADPLDVASWGALFLRAIGRTDLADRALQHAAAFASTGGGVTGYRAWFPQAAFPTAPANVWVEGSAGVALAQLRAGDTTSHTATLAQLARLQHTDGSLPCATTADVPTSMTTTSCVAAATWFVLASAAPTAPSIWDV